MLLLIGTLLYACKKETGPQGQAGPSLTGNLSGYVFLTDQYQQKIYPLSNTTVKIASSSISAVTDSSGKYTFSNLTTGTYEIDYTHAGCGSFKKTGQQFLGGGNLLVSDVHLSVIPAFTILKDSAYITQKDTSQINVKIVLGNSDSTRTRGLIYFVGTAPNVSSDPSTYLISFTGNATQNKNTELFAITVVSLYRAGFHPGQSIYIKPYPTSSGGTYEDPDTGETIFPTLGMPGMPLVITLP